MYVSMNDEFYADEEGGSEWRGVRENRVFRGVREKTVS